MVLLINLKKLLMQEFHEVDWDKKLKFQKNLLIYQKRILIQYRRGKIYSEFSKILLFEENQNILDFDEKRE